MIPLVPGIRIDGVPCWLTDVPATRPAGSTSDQQSARPHYLCSLGHHAESPAAHQTTADRWSGLSPSRSGTPILSPTSQHRRRRAKSGMPAGMLYADACRRHADNCHADALRTFAPRAIATLPTGSFNCAPFARRSSRMPAGMLGRTACLPACLAWHASAVHDAHRTCRRAATRR